MSKTSYQQHPSTQNYEEDEEIQLDDDLTTEQVNSKDDGDYEVYRQDTQSEKKSTEQIVPKQNESSIKEQQAQNGVSESVTLKEKLLMMFTNIIKDKKNDSASNSNNKSEVQSINQNYNNNADAFAEIGKKQEQFGFIIDNDIDVQYSEELNKANQKKQEETEQIRREAQLEELSKERQKRRQDKKQKGKEKKSKIDSDEQIVNNNSNSQSGKNDNKTRKFSDERERVDSGDENDVHPHDTRGLVNGQDKIFQESKIQQYVFNDLLNRFQNIKIVSSKASEHHPNQENNNSNDNSNKEIIPIKGTQIEFNENQFYKSTKENSKKSSGLFSFLKGSVTRYLTIISHHLVISEKLSGNKYYVKSITPLSDLFQVYNERNTPSLKLFFFNKQRSSMIVPRRKVYDITDKSKFLKELEQCLNSLGKQITEM